MLINLFPQRPDHPLADAKELKRILAELHVEKAAHAVDELASWFESLKHARNFRLDHYFDVLRQLDDAGQPHLRRLARDYLYSPFLSRLELQRLWERNYGYWTAVAALYALCTTRARLEPKERGADAFKVSLPLADARLHAARRTLIKWLAYRYEPVEGEIWKSLGRTSLLAEAAPCWPKRQAMRRSRFSFIRVTRVRAVPGINICTHWYFLPPRWMACCRNRSNWPIG